MVSLIIAGAADPGAVWRRVRAIAEQGGTADPVRIDNLRPRWPPKGLMLEVRARRGRWPAPLVALSVLVQTLFVGWVLWRDKPIGSFVPEEYRREITTNTDFSKCDDVVALVLDCDEQAVAALRAELDRAQAAGELRYGMHLSETAMMTCLVSSLSEHRHAHFVDGGNGGFAMAARGMKALRLAAVS